MTHFLASILPERASNLALEVDWIFYSLTALCGLITLLVAALIIFFCVRYRKGSPANREMRGGKTGKFYAYALEFSWTALPMMIFIGIFIWAGTVFFHMSKAPLDAEEIYVTGKQWMWKIQHADGRRELNELHLPLGQPVKLIMTSEDVIHDFFVPAFRTKQDVVPGRYTTEWFTPTKAGKYHFFCAQYCGTSHATMGGWIFVDEPEAHARWLAGQTASTTLAAQGEKVFHQMGCSGCHSAGSQISAPLLDGIYGKQVPLSDNTFVTVDDQYLHDSILQPNKQIAAGFDPLMPTFQNQINEQDLNAVIAYLKSLSAKERTNP